MADLWVSSARAYDSSNGEGWRHRSLGCSKPLWEDCAGDNVPALPASDKMRYPKQSNSKSANQNMEFCMAQA